MINKIPEKWVEKLAKLPETGMGYQTAVFHLNDGSTVELNIVNCDETTENISFNWHDVVSVKVKRR